MLQQLPRVSAPKCNRTKKPFLLQERFLIDVTDDLDRNVHVALGMVAGTH